MATPEEALTSGLFSFVGLPFEIAERKHAVDYHQPTPMNVLNSSWIAGASASAEPSLTPSQQKAGLALAEAIIPGSSSIPGADEATIRLAEEMMRELPGPIFKAWGLAQQALDAAAIARTARPFHALSSERQQALLLDWQGDVVLRAPLALLTVVLKTAHFDRLDVYRAMGRERNVVTRMEQPRWLQQIHQAEDWTEGDVECDAVVVGTGAGGGVAGRELAERGHAVVFLEEGQHYRRDAFDGSSIAAHKRFYRAAISVGNAIIPVFIGRLVGGSTAINTGTSFRTPPWILERWCEEIGTDAFEPSRMAPFFERVETFIDVTPATREQYGPIGGFMARGCDALGWSHVPLRRNARDCDGQGFCDFGCRTDARRGTNLSYVPAALEKGAMVLTGARVEKVLVENGRAVGVLATARNGKSIKVRARAVVLSGGAVPTPLLLLKQGLANSSGQVGRNLSLHPSTGFAALSDDDIRPAHNTPQGYASEQFLREGILINSAQPDVNIAALIFSSVGRELMSRLSELQRIASFGLMIRDHKASGRVWGTAAGFPAISYNLAREDIDLMHSAMIHAAEMCLAAGSTRIYPLLLGRPPVLENARDLDRFRKLKIAANDLILTSYHPLGTCKMGKDPKTSVVGLDHQTHDVKGLYVADGSTVPGPLGVNPQITIMSTVTRAAGMIADAL
jgi:choline dehydrogenase-like flavoprotein